jgi:hypothetical protein
MARARLKSRQAKTKRKPSRRRKASGTADTDPEPKAATTARTLGFKREAAVGGSDGPDVQGAAPRTQVHGSARRTKVRSGRSVSFRFGGGDPAAQDQDAGVEQALPGGLRCLIRSITPHRGSCPRGRRPRPGRSGTRPGWPRVRCGTLPRIPAGKRTSAAAGWGPVPRSDGRHG